MPRFFRRFFFSLLALTAVLLGTLPAFAADKEETVRQCVAVLRARPEDAAAKAALRFVFTGEYPASLPADVTAYLPVPFQRCEDQITATGPAQRAFYTTGLAFPGADHRQAPGSGETVNRVLYAYMQEGEGGDWRLIFRMLYNQSDAGAAELAPRALRLLLRVRAVYAAHLDCRKQILAQPVNVWIRGEGDGGAEQTGNELILLGADKKREPFELLRQLAHEFGHLALPAIGPFTEPEPWGNGFLGEVLFLRWLSRAPVAADALVPPEALAAYIRQEVEPLPRAFTAVGWDAFAGNDTSAGSLRLLLGMILHLEDTRGAEAVAQLARIVRGTTVHDWITAARTLE